MREQYGEQGAHFAEGLIGVSEEEQQMRSLQRRYGSELPEDAELDRSMRERITDPSDLGGIDKLLMALSGTASVAPRLAMGASGTESGTLLADAMGSYKKGDTLGAGLQTGLALLPAGLGLLGKELSSGGGKGLDDLFPKQQTEASLAGTPYTMSVADEPLYFSKQTGKMGGGGGKMTDEIDLKGFEEDFPELFKLTKGSSMSDNIADDFDYLDIDGAGVANALKKYNLTFDDMKKIDIDSPEIYNDTVAEGRDLLESLELLTYPRKKPLYSQPINDEMGSLDFYDTKNGPIGMMLMDVDDSIEEIAFFIPNKQGLSKLDNPPTTGRTRLDEIETDKLSSLKNELYQKEAIRQREYSTMAPKSLSKLDNEIGKLKAEINALTGK